MLSWVWYLRVVFCHLVFTLFWLFIPWCSCMIFVFCFGLNYKAFRPWNNVGLWVAVCFLAKIFLHRPTCEATFAHWHSHRQSRSHFAFSSLSDQWEIRLFFIFRNSFLYKITVSFAMVIKRSLGGEYAGGGQSTSKSTCEVPAWTVTAFGDRSASSMSK